MLSTENGFVTLKARRINLYIGLFLVLMIISGTFLLILDAFLVDIGSVDYLEGCIFLVVLAFGSYLIIKGYFKTKLVLSPSVLSMSRVGRTDFESTWNNLTVEINLTSKASIFTNPRYTPIATVTKKDTGESLEIYASLLERPYEIPDLLKKYQMSYGNN